MRYPNKIRPTREKAEKSQRDVAETAGFALSYYQQVEDGESMPTLPKARDLAAALGCTVDELWPVVLPAAANEG
jgi:transcriptional regulator with XRE-family HTH domain